jgi:hypothetical protein
MTVKRKICKVCCIHQKKKDHPLWCYECWLSRQPIEFKEKWAHWRKNAIPPIYHLSRVPKEDWPEGRRWCSGCQSFVRLSDCSNGASRCKTCNSVSAHAGAVEKKYGITAAQYKDLFVAQGGRCYICQRQTHTKRLAVDHDHATGEVRGLLCADGERGCNHAILGNIRDLAMARRIVAYLEEPPARSVLTSP